MRQLIIDKLKRLYWVWIFLFLLGLISGCFVPLHQDNPIEQPSALRFIWFAGVGGWLAELGSGYGRVLLTLPLTVRQMGRFLWFVAVGMPAMVIALGLGLGLLLQSHDQTSMVNLLVLWLKAALVIWLFFGTCFWLFSGTPSTEPNAKTTNGKIHLSYPVVFVIASICFGYWLYNAHIGYEAKYLILCLTLAAFTLLGWFRAEELLVDYGGYRQIASSPTRRGTNLTLSSKFGGIRFLATHLLKKQLLRILFGFTAIFAVMALLYLKRGWQEFSISCWLMTWSFGGLIFVFSIQDLALLVLHVKYLRTLPMTARQMAALFLLGRVNTNA